MTNTPQPLPYDEALFAAWQPWFMSEAEIEERDASLAGRWPAVLPTVTALDDAAEEAAEQAAWQARQDNPVAAFL